MRNLHSNLNFEILRIRVKKEDSAFVYAVLEASEGIASYSTVDYQPGAWFRDLELQIPPGLRQEVDATLRSLEESLLSPILIIS
jgi:hypothetical protein